MADDLSIETTSTGGRNDRRWLSPADVQVPTALPGTLDTTKFDDLVDDYGYVLSGTPVTKSGDLYVPFDTATAGAVLDGYVYSDVATWNALNTRAAAGRAMFALQKQGTIYRSKLPVEAARTAIDRDTPTSGLFIYAG